MVIRFFLAASALVLLCVSATFGTEVRKYQFAGDVPASLSSCGECSGPPSTIRAMVEGSFEVELDHELGFGTLLSLDAQLTNSEGLFGENLWQPFGSDREFLGPSSFYDKYRPPFKGILEPAAYRPLGPDSLTAEQRQQFIGVRPSEIPDPIDYWMSNRIGFETAPADSWLLTFNSRIAGLTNPNGTIAIVASFNIYFEDDQALLTYNLPIIDNTQSITAARAFLTPEPASISLTCFAMCWMFALRRRSWVVGS